MTDLLIFVEDDGAANLIRGLSPYWRARRINVVLLAAGQAAKKLEAWGEKYVAWNHDAATALEQWQPRLVVVGTSENRDTVALSLVAEARSRGIPTVGLIDAEANAAWRWRGRSEAALTYMPDRLVVTDEVTRKAYRSLGVAAERIEIIGYTHVDYAAEIRHTLAQEGRKAVRQRVLPLEAVGRSVVVFIAEQFTGIDPTHSYKARVVAALNATLAAVAFQTPRPYVIVRLHPKSSPDDFADYSSAIDFVSHGTDALPVVYSGDMVIGTTSTLLFEAALLERPTVAFLPAGEATDGHPSIMAGVTPVATTERELEEYMSRIVSDAYSVPPWPTAWQTGARQRLVEHLARGVAV